MRVAPMACLSSPWTSSAPIAWTSQAPRNAVGTEPSTSQKAICRLGFPLRQCTPAPMTLLTALTTRSLATAAVGGMPTRMSAGVINAPPPIPVRPITTPIARLTTSRSRESPVISVAGTGSDPQDGADDPLRDLFCGAVLGADVQIGRERRLVRRGDAGELCDLPRPGPGVEPLGVARLALGQGRVHEDLGEREVGLDVDGARRVAVGAHG